MAVKQTAGRDALGEFAPKFAELNDDVLFGEVWAEVATLGEQCADFNTFENRFASEGFSEKFVALICQCTQKASPQTKEQRRESLKAAKSMMRENRKETAEYFADSVLTSARVEAEGRILKENRERMIENDTMGDYTRAKNAIEDGISLFGFLLNKFKK